jgi:hypothetical protein
MFFFLQAKGGVLRDEKTSSYLHHRCGDGNTISQSERKIQGHSRPIKITEGGGPPVLSKEKGRRAVFFVAVVSDECSVFDTAMIFTLLCHSEHSSLTTAFFAFGPCSPHKPYTARWLLRKRTAAPQNERLQNVPQPRCSKPAFAHLARPQHKLHQLPLPTLPHSAVRCAARPAHLAAHSANPGTGRPRLAGGAGRNHRPKQKKAPVAIAANGGEIIGSEKQRRYTGHQSTLHCSSMVTITMSAPAPTLKICEPPVEVTSTFASCVPVFVSSRKPKPPVGTKTP